MVNGHFKQIFYFNFITLFFSAISLISNTNGYNTELKQQLNKYNSTQAAVPDINA